MRIRIFAAIVALALLAGATALGEGYRVADGNQQNFGELLVDLMHAYEKPAPGDGEAIESALAAIEAVDARDGVVAREIAEHWERVYVNADGSYRLYLYGGGDRATALEGTEIVDSATHAFVVLGYELKNGEMTPELKGRCDAAAAAARSFPSAILVCSGGATGSNNPENHTEAGMMKDYLAREKGIDPGRIIIDEQAMTTAENAVNTFEMLRERGIETYTVVTSSYHQKWGQVLYNAMGAFYRQLYGYSATLVGNYSYDIAPSERFRHDDRFAVRQLASMLGLSEDTVDAMKQMF